VQKKRFEISVEPPDAIILLKRKSVLYWKACEVRTALPSCAAAKVLTAMVLPVDSTG